METATDDVLAQRCGRGDREALGQLYEKYAGDLLAFLRSRVRDPHAADDLHSELWIRVGRRISLFRSGSFRGWLFTCARNLATDFLRKPKMASLSANERDGELSAPTEIEADEESLASLRRCLDNLKATRAEAAFIVVKRMTGARYPSICADFQTAHPGKSLDEARAYKLFFQARQWLKECIEAKPA